MEIQEIYAIQLDAIPDIYRIKRKKKIKRISMIQSLLGLNFIGEMKTIYLVQKFPNIDYMFFCEIYLG